jgi:CRISPR-associated Cas5-like protein
MDILLLRFDAPLMSFGGVMVDQHGPTDRFPGLAMLTGPAGQRPRLPARRLRAPSGFAGPDSLRRPLGP